MNMDSHVGEVSGIDMPGHTDDDHLNFLNLDTTEFFEDSMFDNQNGQDDMYLKMEDVMFQSEQSEQTTTSTLEGNTVGEIGNIDNISVGTAAGRTNLNYENNNRNNNNSENMASNFESLIDNTVVFGRTESIVSSPDEDVSDIPKLAQLISTNENDLPYQMVLEGLPKITRVENQLKLDLVFNPQMVNKFMVHLPTSSISRQKFYLNKDITSYPKSFRGQLLFLNAVLLVNNDTMNTEPQPANVCLKCVHREQRRASRRKSGLSDNMLWCENPNRNAVVFNKKQILTMRNNKINLVTRLVCYCRHHKAKYGFKILFTIRDSNNNLLAKTLSTPIIITDKKPSTVTLPNALNTNQVPTLSTDSKSTSQTHNTSDELSNLIEPKSKYMPSPNSLSEEGSESMASEYVSSNYQDYSSSANTNSIVPRQDSNSSVNFNHHNSITSLTNQRKRSHLNVSISYLQDFPHLNSFDLPQNTIDPDQPVIERIIPARGPTSGGIEVTILGSNFKDGLVITFGNNLALSTQCWNDSTMVTYLPPSQTPGQVFVTVTDPVDANDELSLLNDSMHQIPRAVFTYVDETDRQLIELALQIVGLKMNGKLEDARNIAKKIVGDSNTSSDDISPSTSSQYNGIENYKMDKNVSDETLIIKVLKSMNKSTTPLSMCDTAGRTLLHLACLNGYNDLATLLIQSGARIDIKDAHGFTPLHFASISGNAKIIRLLINCKMNPSQKASNEMTATQLFTLNNDPESNKAYSTITDLFEVSTEERHANINHNIVSRKSSQSSLNSSIFNENLDQVINNLDTNRVFRGENLDENTSSDCDFEDNVSLSQSEIDDEYTENMDDIPIEVPHSEENNELQKQTPQSLWNRMLGHLNDDLPTYDDLFPKTSNPKLSESKIVEVDNASVQDSQASYSMSEEDEEDAFQRKFNRFFLKQKKTFQNDNMLLFFWIPLTLILLTWVTLNRFYSYDESNSMTRFPNQVKNYLMVGIGKLLLGNQRMMTYLKENLNNFQNTGKLSDLIVG